MQKFITLAALVLVIGFLSSCDDENSGQQSKTEAQAKLNALNTKTTSDLEDLANAEGFAALRSLFDLTELDDPFNGRASNNKQKIRNYFRKKGNELRTIFIKKSEGAGRLNTDEPFDFEAHKGIYVWNFDSGEFIKTASSNIIEIQFPTEGSASNNATLKITAYTEVEFYDEEWGGTFFEPQIIQASLTVDNDQVASLDLNIAWDEEGFPLNAAITVGLPPFSGNLTFDISDANVSTASAFIHHNEDILLGTSVSVIYDDPSKSEESIETIVGFVQVQDVKLEGVVDIEGMDHASNVDPNDFVDLALFSGNTKLGDIIFEEDDDEWVPYLQYADGSKERLEDILDPILDELDDLESDMDDNG